MPRRNDDLEALRAEVRRRHKAATSKVSRLRSRGVEVSGTNYDIRRDLSKVKRYNATQLRAYATQLNSFVDRSNAFVPGDSGVPLPAAKWREYKRLEKRYNEIGNREFTKVENMFLPGSTTKVRERRQMLDKSALSGGAMNDPYAEINRKSKGITSIEALERITEQMRSKTTREYLPSELKKSRAQLNEMLTTIGKAEYIEQANSLSEHQFNILWNYTNFANEISLDYEIMKARARGEKERVHEKLHEDANHAIADQLQWASFIPDEPAQKKPRKRR